MTSICVFDIECQGLQDLMLRGDGKVHCLMACELEYTDEEFCIKGHREFYDVSLPPEGDVWLYGGQLSGVPAYLDGFDYLCGHGIIDYDLPILRHHYGLTWDPEKIIDTLFISRKNWPDRPGGHSVDAWAKRLGYVKPAQEDWSVMNTDVRHRCREDGVIEAEILPWVIDEMNKGVKKCET